MLIGSVPALPVLAFEPETEAAEVAQIAAYRDGDVLGFTEKTKTAPAVAIAEPENKAALIKARKDAEVKAKAAKTNDAVSKATLEGTYFRITTLRRLIAHTRLTLSF